MNEENGTLVGVDDIQEIANKMVNIICKIGKMDLLITSEKSVQNYSSNNVAKIFFEHDIVWVSRI